MPINSRHPDYQKFEAPVRRTRITMQGSDAVKNEGKALLPCPSGMDSGTPYVGSQDPHEFYSGIYGSDVSGGEYNHYLVRAEWLPAAEHMREVATKIASRIPPDVIMPSRWRAQIQPHIDDITNTGIPLSSFATWILEEVMTGGRVGVVIDRHGNERLESARRAQWKGVTTEQMINWRTANVHTAYPLNFLMVEEDALVENPEDFYTYKPQKQWTELRMKPRFIAEIDGVRHSDLVYTVQRYAEMEEKGQRSRVSFTKLGEEITPTRFEMPLPFIPFCSFTPKGLSLMPCLPPLLKISDLNLSHYMTSADYEWLLHWTSLVTLFVFGEPKPARANDDVIKMGGMEANYLERSEARAELIEPTGAAAAILRGKLDSVKLEMAQLGSRILAPDRSGVEAAETLARRSAAEHSILQNLISMVEKGLTKLMRYHVWWEGLTEDPNDQRVWVSMNKDLLPEPMSAQDLLAIFEGSEKGILTSSDVHYNLQRGERLAPEHANDFDKWEERRQDELDQVVRRDFQVPAGVQDDDDSDDDPVDS